MSYQALAALPNGSPIKQIRAQVEMVADPRAASEKEAKAGIDPQWVTLKFGSGNIVRLYIKKRNLHFDRALQGKHVMLEPTIQEGKAFGLVMSRWTDAAGKEAWCVSVDTGCQIAITPPPAAEPAPVPAAPEPEEVIEAVAEETTKAVPTVCEPVARRFTEEEKASAQQVIDEAREEEAGGYRIHPNLADACELSVVCHLAVMQAYERAGLNCNQDTLNGKATSMFIEMLKSGKAGDVLKFARGEAKPAARPAFTNKLVPEKPAPAPTLPSKPSPAPAAAPKPAPAPAPSGGRTEASIIATFIKSVEDGTMDQDRMLKMEKLIRDEKIPWLGLCDALLAYCTRLHGAEFTNAAYDKLKGMLKVDGEKLYRTLVMAFPDFLKQVAQAAKAAAA